MQGTRKQQVPGVAESPDPDLYELNLTWLLKARELARSNPGKASLLFGLEKRFSEILNQASIADLRQLAASPLLVYRPRFSVKFWQETCGKGARSLLALRIQALMMAAEEAAER